MSLTGTADHVDVDQGVATDQCIDQCLVRIEVTAVDIFERVTELVHKFWRVIRSRLLIGDSFIDSNYCTKHESSFCYS